jgi:hypothetical protein
MRMYRRLIVSIAATVAVLAPTPAFGQSFKPDSTAFSPSFQQNTTPPPAQQRQQPNTGLGFGIHFGGTWTRASTDDEGVDLSQGSGVVAGIFFGGNRDGRAGLQGEISYLTKKVNASGIDEDGAFDFDLKNKYIQIPILLRINTGSRSNNGPCLFFLVGPSFDIKLSDNLGDIFDDAFDDSINIDDIYEGVEYGIMAGAGFEVARFGVQVRYTWGLNNIFGTDAAKAAGFESAKFNVLQITGIFRIN